MEPDLDFLVLHERYGSVAEPQHEPAVESACAIVSEPTLGEAAEAALLLVDELVASCAACWGSCHAAARAVWLESAGLGAVDAAVKLSLVPAAVSITWLSNDAS